MAVVTVMTAAIAPAAQAQMEVNAGELESVSFGIKMPANAAAAVRIDYDDRNRVDTLSAASAFGEGSALAVATQNTVFSVGSSNAAGNIDTSGVGQRGPKMPLRGVSVDFGRAAFGDEIEGGIFQAAQQGARSGVEQAFEDAQEAE
ncbi:MAG: hypothetical protein AAF703_20630 [Cyanobacteria bacterium P01_D01_bin.105]